MRERWNVPVPRPISSPSASISRDSATSTRRRPLIQRPSATTRPPRPGEVHGRDYLFMTEEEFRAKVDQGQFIEHAVVHGKHLYGIPIEGLRAGMRTGDDVLVTPDVKGAATLRALIPNAISIFLAPANLAELELRLSLGLIHLTSDLASGRLEPSEINPELFVYPQSVDHAEVIRAAADAPDIGRFVAGFAPAQDEYRRLKAALAGFRARAASGGWGVVPDGPTLELGMTDPRVAQLRARLGASNDLEEARLAAAFGAPDLYDEDLKFIRWNSRFTQVSGYADSEIAHMSPLDFFTGKDREVLRARITEVFTRGYADVEADFVTKNHQHIPHYFTGSLIVIEGRRCLIGVGTDISEKKKLQEQFLRAQRLEGIGMLAAGIAHDLNNVLTPILMAGPMLRVRATDPLGSPSRLNMLTKPATSIIVIGELACCASCGELQRAAIAAYAAA